MPKTKTIDTKQLAKAIIELEEKLARRIDGAYRAIASLNKSVARLGAGRPSLEPTKNLLVRREVIASITKDMEHHDESLRLIGMLDNGPCRFALKQCLRELKKYL